MRYFFWLDFQYEMAALFVGLISLILVYMAWASYPKRTDARIPEAPDERSGHELQIGHDPERNPVVPFLVAIYLGAAAWAMLYVFYIWAGSRNF
ncbi:MAG: hypothetical protein ABFD97_26425 [Syntrophobacter sp.]